MYDNAPDKNQSLHARGGYDPCVEATRRQILSNQEKTFYFTRTALMTLTVPPFAGAFFSSREPAGLFTAWR